MGLPRRLTVGDGEALVARFGRDERIDVDLGDVAHVDERACWRNGIIVRLAAG